MKLAWLDCPYARVNDPYPGLCGRYIDTDGNKICDHSEAKPSDRVADRSGDLTTETVQLSSDNPSVENSVLNNQIGKFMWAVYIPIAVYFLYWYLVEKTRIGKRATFFTQKIFRLFWNVILLLSFFIAGISALIDLFSPSMLSYKLHIYSGLVMITVGLLHFIVRFHYFKIVLGDILKRELPKKK